MFLHPGELYFGACTDSVHTLLGSCIAITLWHPLLRIGGMCHFVLPNRPNDSGTAEPDGRYADEAMTLFARSALSHGTRLCEYQAKVFGGANSLGLKPKSDDELIGMRNVEAAISLISEHSIDLLVADVGESGYRRIAFHVDNGDVWVRHALANGKRPASINGSL